MADIAWLFRRLKAMSIPEVLWRVSQKLIEKKEEKIYGAKSVSISSGIFDNKYSDLTFNSDRLYINYKNKKFDLVRTIPLLGGFDYEKYKKEWNSGFQTVNRWEDKFSYNLSYKQRDDIGDARTNWEINRHFQFALLAKNYYADGDEKYLNEFIDLFTDWNNKNPFLHGISWTSVMEVAIRTSNWCYAYCFLDKAKNVPVKILEQIKIGIINMTDYISNHYSRYSSANNHLIVEAFAIGQAGIITDYKPWIELSVEILTRELTLQNYADGVNKELSLHYQSFYMEAMGLMLRLMVKNEIEVPEIWISMLSKMSGYMADCMGSYGEIVEFGDNDEGKILDLCGGFNHYKYVLELMSCLLPKRYISMDNVCENINWLFDENDIDSALKKDIYGNFKSVCYSEGGNTILKSSDGRILIGIDHAELGFGSIAAHGHSDALSFQLFADGMPVFVDPGTYIYHCDIENRNAFRKTENHNTVSINGKNQSEMLGAFLWGKRAECRLINCSIGDNEAVVEAEHNGYSPVVHRRSYIFNNDNKLIITDELSDKSNASVNFILAPDIQPLLENRTAAFRCGVRQIKLSFKSEQPIDIKTTSKKYSSHYGIQESVAGIQVEGCISKIITTIEIK